MNKKTTDNLEIDNSLFTIPNILAIGALFWYLLESITYFTELCIRTIGFVAHTDNVLIFWSSKITSILLSIILAYIFSRKLWKSITNETLNTKKTLITIGLTIIMIQGVLFLYGLLSLNVLPIDTLSSQKDYFSANGLPSNLWTIEPFLTIFKLIAWGLIIIKWKSS